jgi:hypothetical protein
MSCMEAKVQYPSRLRKVPARQEFDVQRAMKMRLVERAGEMVAPSVETDTMP